MSDKGLTNSERREVDRYVEREQPLQDDEEHLCGVDPAVCKHGSAEVVDEWTEVEDDPYRIASFEITCVELECPDCGKHWIETR